MFSAFVVFFFFNASYDLTQTNDPLHCTACIEPTFNPGRRRCRPHLLTCAALAPHHQAQRPSPPNRNFTFVVLVTTQCKNQCKHRKRPNRTENQGPGPGPRARHLGQCPGPRAKDLGQSPGQGPGPGTWDMDLGQGFGAGPRARDLGQGPGPGTTARDQGPGPGTLARGQRPGTRLARKAKSQIKLPD